MKNLQTLIILALTLALLYQTQCNRVECPEVENTSIVYKDSLIYVPDIIHEIEFVPIDKIEYIHDTIRISEAVVQYITPEEDYFVKRFYSDTIKIDTLGHIVVNDTIFTNKIQSRLVKRDLVIPNKTLKPIVTASRELYFGFGASSSQQSFKSIYGGLLLRTKKNNIYGLGLGVSDDLQPILNLQMYWKL